MYVIYQVQNPYAELNLKDETQKYEYLQHSEGGGLSLT
jgi:hypothetical protein